MSGLWQGRLVAVREVRERSRSRAFRASLLLMILVVAGAIVIPAMLESGNRTKRVGLTGSTPIGLLPAIHVQSDAVGARARIHRYQTLAEGRAAVRDGEIDVLVVDARRLEWQRRTDDQLRSVVTGALQLLAVRERAAAAGISPEALGTLVAPVPVENVELGQVAGRGPDDETAAFIMTLLLFWAITTYGTMVLTGVVEEKSSRVVEVLLARTSARNLLAGKIAGIGLLGLAQIGLTAAVALVAATTVHSFDIPAVRGAVLAWVVAWFVLGYALYATMFGSLGSLASRVEDTQSVVGPITAVLIGAYFVSFAAIGSPDAIWARLVSLFPATAPLVMPNRIAMGAAAWWEPPVAVIVTIFAIVALVHLGGRVYTRAILHTGPTLKLRDVWRGTAPSASSTATPATSRRGSWLRRARLNVGGRAGMDEKSNLWTSVALVAIAAGVGVAVGFLVEDVVIGLAVGAGFYALADRIVKAWVGPHHPHASRS